MSEWHRDNPELIGTDADPHMVSPGYRLALQGLPYPDACPSCGDWTGGGVCGDCDD